MEKLNLIGTQPFETKRMKLRAFKLSDAQYIYKNWANSENVTKYLTWNAHKDLEASTKFCVERTKLSGRTDNFDWVIVLNETGEPVGSIGAVRVDTEKREVEIGCVLGEKWWNKGLMTEALEPILAYFFFVVSFDTVIAEHMTDNTASGRVLEKCGMKHCGSSNKVLENKGGVTVETQVYKMTKPEWYAKNIRF
ncbi:GNAT family N-acetyltransferase [uncultured Ruminococcus sp.]|uniref:GNAT family N-acetyltransferase n=1 Tax=uncultured Ruminococcus sp. TaxID=165186 RepID=UPI000EC59654|nr:GNAT family N-acetyltransferase [uncultured Ruminococcus sp.]HCJ40287.1 N-acetyltransferase [Ruminococcus sp.]